MPRGKYVNHKGRSRHFTAPEELAQQTDSSDEEVSGEEEEGQEGATGGARKSNTRAKRKVVKSSSDDSDEESEEDANAKKGVAGLIEIENPNRAVKKATVKLSTLGVKDDVEPKPVLLPSDKKALAKIEARKRYEKLHAEGKTHQAKADLARLAIIRQQREEAAAKREAEKKAAEERKAT